MVGGATSDSSVCVRDVNHSAASFQCPVRYRQYDRWQYDTVQVTCQGLSNVTDCRQTNPPRESVILAPHRSSCGVLSVWLAKALASHFGIPSWDRHPVMCPARGTETGHPPLAWSPGATPRPRRRSGDNSGLTVEASRGWLEAPGCQASGVLPAWPGSRVGCLCRP